MYRFIPRLITGLNQRARLRIMTFITVFDTGLISYVSTRNLAERWGFGTLSWLYPLCLDAVAAVGMDLWMSNSPAKRAAACLSLTAVTLSLAANVADWLYVGPGAAVLGAVPPLTLAALLFTLHVHTANSNPLAQQLGTEADGVDGAEQPQPDEPPDEEASSVAPEDPCHPITAQTPRTAKGPKPTLSDREVLTALRAHEESGTPLSRRRAMSLFNMGTDRANRLLAEARDGAAGQARNGAHVDFADLDRGGDS